MIAIFPEIINTAKQRNIELLAVQIRKYFAGEETYKPTLNLKNIISAIGIKLEHLPLEEDAVLCVKDVAGSFEVVAVINEQIKDERQYQFLIAHLIGHFLLHVQPHIAEGSWKTSGLREVVSPMHRYSRALVTAANGQGQESLEKEADEFAAALLLPIGLLKRAAAKLTSISSLAAFFGVAESVLRRRMDDIKGAGEEPRSFVDAEELMNQGARSRSTLNSDASEATEQMHSSVKEKVSVPRSFAANSYQTMQAKTDTRSKEKGSLPVEGKSKGIERLRKLAKQLDDSVQIDKS